MSVALELSDVSYVLPDGRRLFDGLNLEVRAEEAVVIAGPSGSGKTTLLGIIGGLLVPTAGTVRTAPEAGAFAWILQGLDSLSARSALDNAALYAILDNQPRRTALARAAAALDTVGLTDHAAKRLRNMSGGEIQRVTIARALSCDRPIVLADEPTSQLDRRNARHMMRCLLTTTQSGRSVVIVSHDLDAVGDHCRVVHLDAQGLHDN